MELNYQDFAPMIVKAGLFNSDYEPFASVVARARIWLREYKVRVINIETVVLPNLLGVDSASGEPIRIGSETSSTWHQVVRVWYDATAETEA